MGRVRTFQCKTCGQRIRVDGRESEADSEESTERNFALPPMPKPPAFPEVPPAPRLPRVESERDTLANANSPEEEEEIPDSERVTLIRDWSDEDGEEVDAHERDTLHLEPKTSPMASRSAPPIKLASVAPAKPKSSRPPPKPQPTHPPSKPLSVAPQASQARRVSSKPPPFSRPPKPTPEATVTPQSSRPPGQAYADGRERLPTPAPRSSNPGPAVSSMLPTPAPRPPDAHSSLPPAALPSAGYSQSAELGLDPASPLASNVVPEFKRSTPLGRKLAAVAGVLAVLTLGALFFVPSSKSTAGHASHPETIQQDTNAQLNANAAPEAANTTELPAASATPSSKAATPVEPAKPEGFEKLMGKLVESVEQCHKGGRVSGEAVLNLTILPSGKISKAEVVGEPIASAPVSRCIVARALAVRAPEFGGEAFVESRPIKLVN